MLKAGRFLGFYLFFCISTALPINMAASFEKPTKEIENGEEFVAEKNTLVKLCKKKNRADPLFFQAYSILIRDNIEFDLLKQVETHQLLPNELSKVNPFYLLGQDKYGEHFCVNRDSVENCTNHRTITCLREIEETILKMVRKEAVPSLADYILGQLVLEWGHTSSKNNQIAFNYLKNAEGLKYAPALYALANCYELGIGCSPNMDYCINLLKQAADLGHVQAQYQLAVYMN